MGSYLLCVYQRGKHYVFLQRSVPMAERHWIKKTPLLRSMEALNKQALRILHLFGNDDVKCVRTSVGPEQEYFLITKKMYEQRKDLRFTGRTPFWCEAAKGTGDG